MRGCGQGFEKFRRFEQRAIGTLMPNIYSWCGEPFEKKLPNKLDWMEVEAKLL